MKYNDSTFARGYLAASERYNIRQNEKIMSSDAWHARCHSNLPCRASYGTQEQNVRMQRGGKDGKMDRTDSMIKRCRGRYRKKKRERERERWIRENFW